MLHAYVEVQTMHALAGAEMSSSLLRFTACHASESMNRNGARAHLQRGDREVDGESWSAL